MLKTLLQKWFGRRSKTTVIFTLKLKQFELGWTHSYRHLPDGNRPVRFYYDTTTFQSQDCGYEFPWNYEKLTLDQVTSRHRISSLYVEKLHAFFERLKTQSKEKVIYLCFEMDEDMTAYVTQNSENGILDYCLNNFKGYRLVKPTEDGTWGTVTPLERITLEEIYNASRRKPSDDPKGV